MCQYDIPISISLSKEIINHTLQALIGSTMLIFSFFQTAENNNVWKKWTFPTMYLPFRLATSPDLINVPLAFLAVELLVLDSFPSDWKIDTVLFVMTSRVLSQPIFIGSGWSTYIWGQMSTKTISKKMRLENLNFPKGVIHKPLGQLRWREGG